MELASRIDRHRRGHSAGERDACSNYRLGPGPLVRTMLGLLPFDRPGAPVNRPSRSVAAFQIHA